MNGQEAMTTSKALEMGTPLSPAASARVNRSSTRGLAPAVHINRYREVRKGLTSNDIIGHPLD
jgi:hypothetical protein